MKRSTSNTLISVEFVCCFFIFVLFTVFSRLAICRKHQHVHQNRNNINCICCVYCEILKLAETRNVFYDRRIYLNIFCNFQQCSSSILHPKSKTMFTVCAYIILTVTILCDSNRSAIFIRILHAHCTR